MTQTNQSKRPMAPMLKFAITAGIVLGVLFLAAFTLLQAVGSTSDPNYLRTGTVQTTPTVNIRGQLD